MRLLAHAWTPRDGQLVVVGRSGPGGDLLVGAREVGAEVVAAVLESRHPGPWAQAQLEVLLAVPGAAEGRDGRPSLGSRVGALTPPGVRGRVVSMEARAG